MSKYVVSHKKGFIALVALLCLTLVASGCSLLPESGFIRRKKQLHHAGLRRLRAPFDQPPRVVQDALEAELEVLLVGRADVMSLCRHLG